MRGIVKVDAMSKIDGLNDTAHRKGVVHTGEMPGFS